ncbi:MAG: acetate/propionate family kinase [Verrucomicrobia bacterium]|nr:acetate/propionate family kinase [Verrucomicrobiota bacterium]
MKVLIANIGSTSFKYRLFDMSNEAVLAKGGYERVTDYGDAIEKSLAEMKASGALTRLEDLAAVGFKTVLAKGILGCAELTEDVLKAMEAMNDVAPSHNPPYIAGIRKFREKLPRTPLIGLFETAWNANAPEAGQRYAVSEQWCEWGVRRYGYHGASHRYVTERVAKLLGRDDLRVISCHLGGSSSIGAARGLRSFGNSLGMSPQSGVPHNNRVGDLDSFAIPFLMKSHGLTLDQVVKAMNKEGGLLGISGVSNDIRDVDAAAKQGNKRAQLALDVFTHSIRHWIGAFMLQLNGADAIVFTAGIGENRTEIRAGVCKDLDWFGIKLDAQKNAVVQRGQEAVISADDSRTKIMVVPTNEEIVVAREAVKLLESKRK